MGKRAFRKAAGVVAAILTIVATEPLRATVGGQPNVLLIVCDDLNDYVSGLNGHPQARTPHLEQLAESGVSFTRAYTNSPLCAPSRSSFLTGIYPHTSRNHSTTPWFRNSILKNSRTLMDHFKQNGYLVLGSGKLMHHLRREEWTEFKHAPDYGPLWYRDGRRVSHPGVAEPFASIGPIDGSYGALEDALSLADHSNGEGWIYGSRKKTVPMRWNGSEHRGPTPDERNAAWAAAKIDELSHSETAQPFFLAVGFVRPHTPLHVPRKYFDLFPLDGVRLPLLKEGDAGDTGLADVAGKNAKGPMYFRLLRESYNGTLEGLRAFTQAYLASVAAVDESIGRVISALDQSRFRENTIVVVTSDHGWNMGEKGWLYKMATWEESLRVPLIIRAPGVSRAGGRSGHPVSLVDLYPTLVDLAGLQGDTRKNKKGAKLDGHSLRPFLEDPENGFWDGPDAALSTVYSGPEYETIAEMQHFSLRTRDFRYIRYSNGFEEFYDHRNDPYEWNNLADDSRYELLRKKLRQKLNSITGLSVGVLPPREPTPLENGKVFDITFEEGFDLGENTFTWPATHRSILTRERSRVISGRASLHLKSSGSPWNTISFKTIEVAPGVTANVSFDVRALENRRNGFFYYLLTRGKFSSPLIRVPIAQGELKTVTGKVTNDQHIVTNLVLGFSQGGTYVVDNLRVEKD